MEKSLSESLNYWIIRIMKSVYKCNFNDWPSSSFRFLIRLTMTDCFAFAILILFGAKILLCERSMRLTPLSGIPIRKRIKRIGKNLMRFWICTHSLCRLTWRILYSSCGITGMVAVRSMERFYYIFFHWPNRSKNIISPGLNNWQNSSI